MSLSSLQSSTAPRTARPSAPIRTHDSNGNLLPGILCLHGAGSNATVFKIQCRRLMWNMGTHFRFVFVEAPHLSPAGLGMLPIFESCEPFYRWVTAKYAGVEAAIEVPTQAAVREIDEVLQKAMKDNGGMETFVGVVGFSQGARVAMGLLLRQKMAERDRRECVTRFKFGVMIGGPNPPVVMDGEDGEVQVVPEKDYPLLKEIPAVHTWGDEDPYRLGAEKMADLSVGEVCRTFEFPGSHHLPLLDADAKTLSDCILETWKIAGGEIQAQQ